MGPDPRTGNPIQREGDLKTLWQRQSWEDRATDQLPAHQALQEVGSFCPEPRKGACAPHTPGRWGTTSWCLRPLTGTSLFHGLRTLLQG